MIERDGSQKFAVAHEPSDEALSRNGAIEAWRTSREAFEDLDPFKGGGDMKLRHYDDQVGGLGLSAMLLSLGGDRKITRPYLQNPWVYACIQAIARAVASLPVQVLSKKGSDATPIEDPSNGVVRLFDAPNPLQSQAKFLKQLVNYHLLWGETYLICMRSQRMEQPGRPARVEYVPVRALEGEGLLAKIEEPEEIWPVAGHLVEEVVDKRNGPLPYEYRVHTGSGVTRYPAHAVVQLADANPHSVLRGVGPMTAALRDAAKGYQIDRYDDAILKNGGSPGGTLQLEGAVSDLELRAIRDSWREAHERADNHRKTAILTHGTKYVTHGFTPQEMEFTSMREWIRQTIMAVFGVTKPILGITDDVNMANSREAYRVFWETTVIPLVRFFEDEVNFKLIRRVRDWNNAGFYWALDLDGVEALREDIDAKVERTLKLYEKGHRTFNEAAMLAGWDLGEQSLEGDGERWIQSTLKPVDQALAPPQPPPGLAPADEQQDDDESSDQQDDDGSDRGLQTRIDAERAAEFEVYWRGYDEFLREREVSMQRVVFNEFRAFLSSVEDRLDEIVASDLAQAASAASPKRRFVVTESELERLLKLNMDTWNDSMLKAMTPQLVGTMVAAAEQIHFEVGGAGLLMQGTDPAVLEILRLQQVKIVEGYTSNLAQALQKRMVAVLAEAPGNPASLAQAIAEVLEQLKGEVSIMRDQAGRRAMMIARTEVNAASSAARFDQMQKDGIKSHTWVSARDAQVREHHAELDGRTRVIGDTFGYGLRYPGDKNGAASEVINCRCTVIPELEGTDE